MTAAQFAAAMQGQQPGGEGPTGSNPQQPAQNPTLAGAQNPGLASRWPDGIDAAAAAAAAGFWPGLGGGVGLSADAAGAAGSERLPGLTGLGMSGMTPMGGLSAGQGQCGGMGMGTQLMGQGGTRGAVGPAATAPSVGGGDDGGRSFVDAGRAAPSAAAGGGPAGAAGGGSAAAGYGQGGSVAWEAAQQAAAQGQQQQQPLASAAVQAGVGSAPSWL
jgi:hypothetical protein